MTLTTDQVYPRNLEERFRLYARSGKDLRIVATGPDGASVGQALVQCWEESAWEESAQIGVLDTMSGRWVANPFADG